MDYEPKHGAPCPTPYSTDDAAKLCISALTRIRAIARNTRRSKSKGAMQEALAAILDIAHTAHNIPEFLMEEKTAFSSNMESLDRYCKECEQALRTTSDL